MTKTAKKPAADFGKLVERDLTALAREGRLPAAHGVDAAVADLEALLARGEKAPLLAGEPGVGKSALVQQLARRIVEGRVPEQLSDARVLEVPLGGVWSRADDGRRAAELLEGLLEKLAASGERIVVFVRDGHVVGSSLRPVVVSALRRRALRFVFEATPRAAQSLLQGDEAFAQCVHLVQVPEPTVEATRWILGRTAEDIEEGMGLPIDPDACDVALSLSSRFLLQSRLPRKALDLLREAAAEAAASGRDRVTADDVLRRFCAVTRLPRFLVDDGVPLDLADTERFFGERILGQPEAVATVLRSVALLKAGLNDPRRPLGVFLFPGPTGVGKTHLAKLLAEYLFGAADRLVRINMADYGNEGEEHQLFGASWSDSLEGRRGLLTRLLEDKVFTVLLLDEFEKTVRSVHDRCLQLFDEGQFINGADETVICSNVLIIATSNVGAEVYREQAIGFGSAPTPEELVAEVDRRIAATFRAEFLNRFDALCHFLPLGKVEIRRIAQREVGRVLERTGIRSRGLEVEVEPAVIDLLVERGHSPLFGARFLQREIEKTLSTALAVEIARRPLPPGTRVVVEARPGGRVVANVESRPAPEPTTQVALAQAGVHVARRRLDKDELLAAANDLVHRAEALAARSEKPGLLARRAALLEASQAPDFWEQPERAACTLREFRDVEAVLGELERLSRVCGQARRAAREAKGEGQLALAARTVEQAGRDVQLAEARAAAGGGPQSDESMLEIRAGGDSDAHTAWVRELLAMYTAWAERRGFHAHPVAEAQHPARVVVQISGPGVRGFLAGEQGLHRRLEEGARVVASVAAHAPPAPAADVEGRAHEIKRRAGAFVERLASEASVSDEATGRAVLLRGSLTPAELCALAQALIAAESAACGEARRYHVGRGARVEDPRTGAGTPRLKDVLRGELDLFIAAWLSRPPEVRP